MTRRAAKGDGNIRERLDGRWEARITINGHSRSFFGPTKEAARRSMRVAQKRIEDGQSVPSRRTTVAAYLAAWLDGQKGTMTPESWRRYKGRLDRLLPHVGKVRLALLEPEHLWTAYAKLGEELSGTTIQLCHGVLHRALQDAEMTGKVARNVAALVKAPKRDTAEYRSLGGDDARALMTAAKGDPLEAFYVVALTCGLRLGEIQALQWHDLDLRRRRLSVRRTLAVDGKPVFNSTSAKKNHQRTVWLSEAAADALQRHAAAHETRRIAAGDTWTEHDLVFTTGTGNPLDGRNIRGRSFPRLLARAGLPKMRLHDLRHTAASLLLAEGVPVKVVSEMLGHTDVNTTLRIYAHVLEGAQGQAVSVMDRLFHA